MDFLLTLNRQDAAALAPLRLAPGMEVAEDGARLWLRGKNTNESLGQALLRLPASERYEWLPNHQMRRCGERIPSGSLPVLSWQPLALWLKVETGPVAFPGDPPFAVPLRLVRSSAEGTPDLLLTGLDGWTRFARQAPEIRLKPLRFAVNQAAAVLVLGKPLPPLPGQRFLLHGSIAVPAGLSWEPCVSPPVLQHLFALANDDLVLWHEDGTFERLQSEQFVPASRSAIQATACGFAVAS